MTDPGLTFMLSLGQNDTLKIYQAFFQHGTAWLIFPKEHKTF